MDGSESQDAGTPALHDRELWHDRVKHMERHTWIIRTLLELANRGGLKNPTLRLSQESRYIRFSGSYETGHLYNGVIKGPMKPVTYP